MKLRSTRNALTLPSLAPFFFLLLPLVFCCFIASAQPAQNTDSLAKTAVTVVRDLLRPNSPGATAPAKKSAADKPPLARNMEEFKKTPQYAKRKAAYDKATPGPNTKHVKFQDGSGMTIKLDRKSPTDMVTGPVRKQVGKEKKTSSGGMDCTETVINLTATSDNFLNNDYSGSTANIYPGACYTYAHLTDGSWEEQKGERYPITITSDNPNIKGPSYATVEHPNMATIQTAIGKIFSGFKNSNGNESLSYQVSDVENSSTYNLNIGAAASGYGVDLSNVYSTGNQSNHVHLTIDATKTFFTISTVPPDSGFFKDQKVESTPYLSVIGEVSYGVRVLANADLTFATQQEADNFKGSYSGYGVKASLDVNFANSSKNTTATINGYTIGGPGNQVIAYSLNELKQQIDKAFAEATYQNARPIKYKSYSMAGDVLNTYTATDNFTVRNCIPADGGSPEIESIVVTLTQGSDGKEPATQFYVGMFPGMNSSAANVQDAMFIYSTADKGTQWFPNNGIQTIVLYPNKQYKGKLDLASFEKAGGGHFHIYPISYKPYSTGGIGYDNWNIDGISIQINIKASAANPTATGPKLFSYSLKGPNELQLSSRSNASGDFYFDGGFNPQGTH